MKESISIKRALIDLMDIRSQLRTIYSGQPQFNEIISFINDKDYLNDDVKIPTFNEIEKITGIKVALLRKLIKKMYLQLFDSERKSSLEFQNTEFYFNIKYLRKHTTLKVDKLQMLPKIGDQVNLNFVKAKVGANYFYVENIVHRFYEDKQIFDIYLKVGVYNSYWYFRKHEAFERGEISFSDSYNKSDYELKEILRLRKGPF